MATSTLRLNIAHTPATRHHAAQKLSRLQTDLVLTAQNWAVGEVSAVMADQLNVPLTSLLIYLNEIKTNGLMFGTDAASDLVREMIEKALFETERQILKELGHMTTETEISGIRSAAQASTMEDHLSISDLASRYPRIAKRHSLTPREYEVLEHITSGASNKEGGCRLGISTRTFEVHRAHIMMQRTRLIWCASQWVRTCRRLLPRSHNIERAVAAYLDICKHGEDGRTRATLSSASGEALLS